MKIDYLNVTGQPIAKDTRCVIYRLLMYRENIFIGLYIGQTVQPMNIRLAQHLGE